MDDKERQKQDVLDKNDDANNKDVKGIKHDKDNDLVKITNNEKDDVKEHIGGGNVIKDGKQNVVEEQGRKNNNNNDVGSKAETKITKEEKNNDDKLVQQIKEQVAKENALKIKQQQEDVKMQEMQEWMQKMKQNAFKEKIKKEIQAENEAKKNNNSNGSFSDGGSENVFSGSISAQADYAKDELKRIKKIEDDLKELCNTTTINDAYTTFNTTCDENNKKADDAKDKLKTALDKDIKQLKNDFDVPAGAAQFDANELIKSVFSYAGDDLSTNIGGYTMICNKITEYKNKYPIKQMEYDEKTGKEKNILDNDIVEERKILNTQLDALLDNTDLFSADAVKEEITKRYNDISKNNATGAIMTFIYALIDFVLGKNRHKSKVQLCDLLWQMYCDVGDVKSFDKVNKARKSLMENYDLYQDLLAYMPTWVFYPELYEIDKTGHKIIKKDILDDYIKKVSVEAGYSDKVKFICQNLYKIVGGNSFHALIGNVSKKQMDTIIDAICSSNILPVGIEPAVYKKIIRKTIEASLPNRKKLKEGIDTKVDGIMQEFNINESLRPHIEQLCNGSIGMNKKIKSEKSSNEKKSFKEAKFLGDKLMVDNDKFDAKKDAVKGLIATVCNGLELNINQTITYLNNINSIDIDIGAKMVTENHKIILKSMIEKQRASLLGIVDDKFVDDKLEAKNLMENVKKMVEKIRDADYFDAKNNKPATGKMTKYDDLDFDFRDLSNEANETREELKKSINAMCDKMLEKINSIDVGQNIDKQRISSMMKDISDGTRKDYKDIEMEKAKYSKQTMDALLEATKNNHRGGGMIPMMMGMGH